MRRLLLLWLLLVMCRRHAGRGAVMNCIDGAPYCCPLRSLCEQRTAMYFASINSTELPIPLQLYQRAGTEVATVCAQLYSIGHVIHCARLDADAATKAQTLLVPQPLRGLQQVALSAYDDDQDLLTSANFFYFVKQHPTDSPFSPRNTAPTAPAALRRRHYEVLSPPYGSLLFSSLHAELKHRIGAPVDGEAPMSEQQMHIDVVGVWQQSFRHDADFISGGDIEPGSWFYTITPLQHGAQFLPQLSMQSTGYWEIVPSANELRAHRQFSLQHRRYDEDISEHSPQQRIPHVCIWSSNKLDGQKRIWLEQVQALAAKVQFSWFVTLPEGRTIADELRFIDADLGSDSVLKQLQLQRSSDSSQLMRSALSHSLLVMDSPYNGEALSLDVLDETPTDGRPSAAAAINDWGVQLEDGIYRYAHESFLAASGDIDKITPSWCKRFYTLLRNAVTNTEQRQPCDVLVYGNSRGFSSDVLITDSARSLGIPSVAELLNLFVDADTAADVFVAPSRFALQHQSVVPVLRSDDNSHGARGIVISPAVDPLFFSSTRLDGKNHFYNKCKHWEATVPPHCLVVGFVARLAPEKNPGLFLQAAFMILREFPIARFIIIGDGELREALEDLAERLGISWAVHFAGWIGQQQLPDVLMGIDVVINTSLRGWSETFCIANIEVMSMGIPLVTFAVGGVGEYIDQPDNVFALQFDEFVETANGVIVNQATPMAVARAALHVLRNMTSSQRTALGQRARDTVQSYFIVRRQMRQYEDLYKLLLYRARHGGGS